MKKIFTLLACVLMAGSAFGQGKVTLVNEKFEGEQDPTYSFFWIQDGRLEGVTDEATGQGYVGLGDAKDIPGWRQFAEIVEDPLNPKNHCIKVHVRSQADGEAAGNLRQDGGTIVSWDTQFFIYTKEEMPVGKFIRLSMKVRGDVAGSFDTQAHETPGEYTYYQLFGSHSYDTTWGDTYVTDWTEVTSNHVTNEGHSFFRAIAFNLASSSFTEGNNIYFDNIKLEMADEIPQEQQQEFTGWFNFLRNGTLSEDSVSIWNGRIITNFTAHEGVTNTSVKAPVVKDPVTGEDALTLTSIWLNYQEVIKTAEGNDSLDADGNPVYNKYWKNEAGDLLKQSDLTDWRTQFHVSIPHKFVKGEKFKLKFKARATKPATIHIQAQGLPDTNKNYLGELSSVIDGGNVELTEEWQEFDWSGTNDEGFDAVANDMQTVSFNCNVKKDEEVTYYFQFEGFYCNAASAKEDERSIKTEKINLPVPAADQEANIKIDMTPLVQTLGIEDLVDFLDGNTMKVRVKTVEGEGDDAEIVESYSGSMQATTGAYIDSNGSMIDDEVGLVLSLPEEGISGNEATINLYNISFVIEKGSPVKTKIIFENNNWFYAYDVTLMDPEDYETGIVEVKQVKADNGLIYNIAGQRVDGSYKGLVIKNGQKFVQK
jgi:hypothetical protein